MLCSDEIEGMGWSRPVTYFYRQTVLAQLIHKVSLAGLADS